MLIIQYTKINLRIALLASRFPYYISKRTMLRTAIKHAVNLNKELGPSVIERSKHTRVIRFKPKSNAANNLASDDSSKHPHLIEEICDKSSCETTTKCPTLCNPLQCWRTKGHFTHNPVSGKFSTYVGNVDTNGQTGGQYFTENGDRTKTADASQAKIYCKNKEASSHIKGDAYLKTQDVADKL